MKSFDELTERGRIDRLRTLAAAALGRYGLKPLSMKHIRHAENVTFDVRASGSGPGTGPGAPYVPGRYLLRLHRPGYHTVQSIRSEMAWLTTLRRDLDLHVPDPVFARDGSLTVYVEEEGVPDGRVCTLLRWMRGSTRTGETVRPGHLRMVGRLMAELHDHATFWDRPEGFVRGRWDWYGLFEKAGTAGTDDSWVWDALPKRVRKQSEPAARETADAIEVLGEGEDAFGLIHADLHLGNILFGQGEARAIDFDDCGEGHWIYDVAVALFDHRSKDDWETWRDALLEGYGDVRELPAGIDPYLETFMCARCVSLLLWVHARARESSRFKRNLKNWSAGLVRYLKEHCTPEA